MVMLHYTLPWLAEAQGARETNASCGECGEAFELLGQVKRTRSSAGGDHPVP